MKQVKKILLVGLSVLIIFSCAHKKDEVKTSKIQALLITPGTGSGLRFKDTVNGIERTYWIRDTLITVNIPYSYNKTLIDTFDRNLVVSGPGDTVVIPPAQPFSFEGFGKDAVGGANSATVYHVTNLNSSGSGSLINGIGSNKTIVFDVSGTIVTRLDLVNIQYLTIDAYSNGRDITINNNNNGDGVSFDGANTHNCIIRGIRVINSGGDGINVVGGSHDIMIDHCTAYNNRDGNIDAAGDNSGQTKNVTIQWCYIGPHSGSEVGGTLITGQSVSLHHNFYIVPSPNLEGERVPFVHCNYSPVGSPNADIRNNLVYTWGRNGGTGSGYATGIGYNATANVVNNYYYDKESAASAIVNGDGYGSGATGKIFSVGNIITNGAALLSQTLGNNHAEYVIPSQYKVNTTDACTAARQIKQFAGTAVRNSAESALTNLNILNCN